MARSNRLNLAGKKIGLLTVKEPAPDIIKKSGRIYPAWYCDCECGTKDYVITTERLRNPKYKSCGCLNNESKFKKKYNKYDLSGEYGIGYTAKGEKFYFDLEDYDKIKHYCWHLSHDGYVAVSNNKEYFLLHRFVMNAPQNYDIDHINHKKYDNRKLNLRIATTLENCANRTPTNKYGINGIVHKGNTWIVSIGYNNKHIYIGSFQSLDDAIKARKEAEEKYYGDFSYGNSMKKFGDL